MLQVNPETVCYLILKAHQQDMKLAPEESGSGTGADAHAMDEETLDHLEEEAETENPTYEEMKSFIEDMNEDEQVDVVALMWLGRDSASAEDWAQIRKDAADAHNEHSAEYLLGTPLLADYLSEGLASLGYDCESFER